VDPLTPDEFLGTNDAKTEGKRLAYITGKSEGVKALLKDIFAESGVPTVGDNDLEPRFTRPWRFSRLSFC